MSTKKNDSNLLCYAILRQTLSSQCLINYIVAQISILFFTFRESLETSRYLFTPQFSKRLQFSTKTCWVSFSVHLLLYNPFYVGKL